MDKDKQSYPAEIRHLFFWSIWSRIFRINKFQRWGICFPSQWGCRESGSPASLLLRPPRPPSPSPPSPSKPPRSSHSSTWSNATGTIRAWFEKVGCVLGGDTKLAPALVIDSNACVKWFISQNVQITLIAVFSCVQWKTLLFLLFPDMKQRTPSSPVWSLMTSTSSTRWELAASGVLSWYDRITIYNISLQKSSIDWWWLLVSVIYYKLFILIHANSVYNICRIRSRETGLTSFRLVWNQFTVCVTFLKVKNFILCLCVCSAICSNFPVQYQGW